MGRVTVQIDRDADALYRWRIRAPNGRMVGVAADGFAEESQCRAHLLRARGSADRLTSWVHHPEGGGSATGWQWVARDGEGGNVAVSPRSYPRHATCRDAFERFLELLAQSVPPPWEGRPPAEGEAHR
ncbi:hypothetical protein [Peterkaempfera sp. SMS 1(5)a]|uniref:hypothetical protein n=1 Tax=Peterkaempfera podocarpi TaxID=3232308 RepID=UPI00366D1F2A